MHHNINDVIIINKYQANQCYSNTVDSVLKVFFLNIYGLPAIQTIFSFFWLSFVLLAKGGLQLINGSWPSPSKFLFPQHLLPSLQLDTMFLSFFWHYMAFGWFYITYPYYQRARGSAVGWGTALQVGRSRVRFLMVSLEFFIDIISAALWPWGWLSL
jgi:hypothetical protein